MTAILSAHPILTEAEGQDAATSTHSHNFEINAADLVDPNGNQVDPQAGMEFTEAMSDGSTNVYEVRPLPRGRAFDPLDAEETRLLVYANYVRNEPG